MAAIRYSLSENPLMKRNGVSSPRSRSVLSNSTPFMRGMRTSLTIRSARLVSRIFSASRPLAAIRGAANPSSFQGTNSAMLSITCLSSSTSKHRIPLSPFFAANRNARKAKARYCILAKRSTALVKRSMVLSASPCSDPVAHAVLDMALPKPPAPPGSARIWPR